MPNFIEPDELQFADGKMAAVFALHRLVAVFLFPKDDDASARERRNVQAQLGMAHIRNSPVPPGQDARTTRLAHDAWAKVLVQSFISFDLADAKGIDHYTKAFTSRLTKWEPVGLALRQLIVAKGFHDSEFRGGATISKFLGAAALANGLDESGVQRYWGEAKPIAHLLTALVHINRVLPERTSLLPSPAELVPMLNFARYCQRFLTESVASRSSFGRSSLPLAKEDVWLIADDGYPHLPIPDKSIQLEAMHPEAVEQVKRRKVPLKPY